MGAEVRLNVYDLLEANKHIAWAGLGVFHSGVEVHGREYAYGGHEFRCAQWKHPRLGGNAGSRRRGGWYWVSAAIRAGAPSLPSGLLLPLLGSRWPRDACSWSVSASQLRASGGPTLATGP